MLPAARINASLVGMVESQQADEPASERALGRASAKRMEFSETVTALLLAQPLNPLSECGFSFLSNRQPEAGNL